MLWGTCRPDGGHSVLGLRVRGTAGPRTTSPAGQLVLGPHVRGNSWSSDTGIYIAGPRYSKEMVNWCVVTGCLNTLSDCVGSMAVAPG